MELVQEKQMQQPAEQAEAVTAEAVYARVATYGLELSVLGPETEAKNEFYDRCGVRMTPLQAVDPTLYERSVPNTDLLMIKAENMQERRSYKVRGAAAFIGHHVRKRRNEGLPALQVVETASAGNHAQGVGQVTQAYGIPLAVAHVPEAIAQPKETAITDLGMTIVKHPQLTNCVSAARKADENPLGLYAPPYNAYEVMAGQSTIFSEILERLLALQQEGDLDLHRDEIHMMMPVGGGGCASGNAVMVKAMKEAGLIGDNVQFWGVQGEGADAVVQAQYGVELEGANPHYEGACVTKPGDLNMAILHDPRFAKLMTVSEGLTGEAMELLYHHHGEDVESTGALAMAGAMQLAQSLPALTDGRKRAIVTVTSGANVAPDTVRHFGQKARAERYAKNSAELHANWLAFKALSASYLPQTPEKERRKRREDPGPEESAEKPKQIASRNKVIGGYAFRFL